MLPVDGDSTNLSGISCHLSKWCNKPNLEFWLKSSKDSSFLIDVPVTVINYQLNMIQEKKVSFIIC